MAWAQNTTTGEWEHSGTTRDAYRWPDPQEAKAWIPYRFAKVTDKPVIMIHLSEDARTGFEIGIMDDAGADIDNLTIRFRDDNVPGAPLYQAAHNIPADTPFDLEVAIDGNGFSATISTTDVDAVRLPTEGNASSGDYSTYRGHAFVSDVNGARIISGGTQPAESVVAVTNSPLVGFAKGNGGVYVRETTDVNWRLIRAGCFSSTDQLSEVEYGGKLLFVAYDSTTRLSRAWKVDVVNATCVPWVGNTGPLPGATDDGTTTIRHLSTLFGRVYGATEYQLYTSASPSYTVVGVDPEDDWLADPAEPGAAQVYTIGTSGREGEPIIAIAPGSAEAMMVFKKRSVYALHGDPVLGQTQEIEVSLSCGITGPKALASVDTGSYYIHTQEGAYIVSLSGAVPLSKSKLRRYMDIGRNQRDAYIVNVAYDMRDALVYFFLVQKNPTATIPRLHPVLDLQTSEFLLDEYWQDHEPTAAVFWNDRLIMGGRDGYCRWFVPFGSSDDGQQFSSKYTVLVETPGASGATYLGSLSLQLGTEVKYRYDRAENANGVAVTVYGGQTAEDAILPNRRTLRAGPMTFNPGRQTHLIGVADHAFAIEITGQGIGFDYSLEDGSITTRPTSLGASERGVARAAASGLCRPVFIAGTPTANVPPVANAGADATYTDTDENGEEYFQLDGTRSTDSDGYITAYRWTDSTGAVVGTTAIAGVYQAAGTSMTYTLRVTDNDGATDTDTVTITVQVGGGGGGGGTVDPPGGGTSTSPGPGTGDVVAEHLISSPGDPSSSGVGGEP